MQQIFSIAFQRKYADSGGNIAAIYRTTASAFTIVNINITKKNTNTLLISRGERKEKGRRKEKNSEDDPLKKRRKKKTSHASGQSYRGEGKRWRLLAGL